MSISTTVYIWVASSAVWLPLMWFIIRHPRLHARLRPWLLTIVVLSMAASVAITDVMSDDALRYRWDGHVVSQGMNPYVASPADPSMQRLAVTDTVNGIRYPDAVTYPHIRTIYPPGAQLLAGMVTRIAGVQVLPWKVVWFIIVAALVAAAIGLLWRDVPRVTILLGVLLCPTVVLHGFVDVHFDTVMALFVLLALIAMERKALFTAGMLFGIAVSVKYVVVLLLPFLLMSLPWRDRLRVAAAAVVALATITLPFASASMFDAFRSFATTWQSNAFLYSALVQAVPEPGIRYILAGIGMALGGVVLMQQWRRPLVAGTLIYLTLFIVSPVVHPWYLITPLLIAPFTLLRASVVWGATVSLYGFAYLAYKGDGVWVEDTVTLALQVVPVVAAFAYDVVRGPVSGAAPDA
ncbi:MAG: DUF2029 domain-containing protein [Candidatus Kapabacteria bacterium]|nr:DUF2029 domain-containing protein [Candidatus Kapabacteria bacterium]